MKTLYSVIVELVELAVEPAIESAVEPVVERVEERVYVFVRGFDVVPIVVVAIAIAVLPGPANAQQETRWMPPPPNPQQSDWVKLTSGEWLRGEIKFLRDDEFEFDSEELDLLKLDWGDIAELRSPKTLEYVFEHGVTAIGTAVMAEGVVRVRTGPNVREFPAASLVSIIEGAQSEWDHWSGKLSVGLIARSGNTNQQDVNSILFLRRESSKTRWDTDYAGNFGELDGISSINNHLLGTTFRVYVSRGFFVTPGSLELFADKFQNIQLRTSVSVGAGYRLVNRASVEWFVELGGGYLRTEYVSVEPGANLVDESGTVIPVTSIEWDPTPDVETTLNYNATIGVPDPANTFHHLVALMDVDIWGMLDFTISFTWDRNENPQPREDGSVPKRDDFRTAFGLGIDF